MKVVILNAMKKQDILSILITFLVGVFVGGYLYLTDAAGRISELKIPDAEEVSEFTIVGDVYGGCRDRCPSFQVINDGSYRYLYTPRNGSEQVLRQGILPLQLQRQLRTVLTENALKQQSRNIEPTVCNSFSDGIDVKYTITIDGKEYKIDSCGTTVDGGSQMWITLGQIWEYYQSL